MKTTIKTWCPIFSGFYNTIWDGDGDVDSEIEYQRDETGRNLTWEDFEIDYEAYRQDVSKTFTAWLSEELKENIPGLLAINFEELRSPKEYNFATDSINVEIDIDAPLFVSWWKRYIIENAEQYAKYLHQKYTSCDGFISHFPNTIDGWTEETENWTVLGSHYLGSMLQFYCENEEIDEMRIYEDLNSNGHCISQYMTLKPFEDCEDYESIETVQRCIADGLFEYDIETLRLMLRDYKTTDFTVDDLFNDVKMQEYFDSMDKETCQTYYKLFCESGKKN